MISFRKLRMVPSYLVSISILSIISIGISQAQDLGGVAVKTDPISIDLYHKFSDNSEFKKRGSISIKLKGGSQKFGPATTINQNKLSQEEVEALKEGEKKYFLRAIVNKPNSRVSETLIKRCSLSSSNLADFIAINLSPYNDFISVNLFTLDPECQLSTIENLSNEFNTTVLVNQGSIGPNPDTATYIKRLEEERQNKLREGKEDNRSFFAKYWIYIVPAVVFLMVFSGPNEQGAR